MSITVNRKNRERRTQGVITFDVVGADVGKTYDFMGIATGFRILDVNVTVDEAFANGDNTISVGLDDDFVKFIPATTVNAIKGITFGNKQFTAKNTTSLVVDIAGSTSATGKATVTVVYAKLPDSRQEY